MCLACLSISSLWRRRDVCLRELEADIKLWMVLAGYCLRRFAHGRLNWGSCSLHKWGDQTHSRRGKSLPDFKILNKQLFDFSKSSASRLSFSQSTLYLKNLCYLLSSEKPDLENFIVNKLKPLWSPSYSCFCEKDALSDNLQELRVCAWLDFKGHTAQPEADALLVSAWGPFCNPSVFPQMLIYQDWFAVHSVQCLEESPY